MSSGFSDELHFGPPSQPINLNDFAQQAVLFEPHDLTLARLNSEWQELEQSDRDRIENELSLEDLQKDIDSVLTNPRVYAYVQRVHEENVATLVADQPQNPLNASQKAKKRKIEVHAPPQDLEDPDVQAFRKRVQLDSLRLFRLDANATLFLRRARFADDNALPDIRPAAKDPVTASEDSIVLIVSVYARSIWHPYGNNRVSQHALLATQTLADLFRVMECPYHRLTTDIYLEQSGDNDVEEPSDTGECVMCVEGVAYGDGTGEGDYANLLHKHLEIYRQDPKLERPSLVRGAGTIHTTTFASLPSLRVNEPYYILHQGSCEHFFVVDQIRLLHPSADPRDGYPQTLQSTPQRRDVCRVCSRMTATLSVVGDRRLGESPCVMCAGCWKKLGWPKGEREDMFAVKLLVSDILGSG